MSRYRNAEGTVWEAFEHAFDWYVRKVGTEGSVAGPVASEYEACHWMAKECAGLTPEQGVSADASMLQFTERETQRRKEAGRERALEELRALLPRYCDVTEESHGSDSLCFARDIHDRIAALEAGS